MLEAEEDYATWKDLPANLKKRIDKSLKQANEENFIPHDEARKKYEKWLSK
jgi:hypothetical protein